MHLACIHKNNKILEYLLDSNIPLSLSAKNSQGLTPLDICSMTHNVECKNLMNIAIAKMTICLKSNPIDRKSEFHNTKEK